MAGEGPSAVGACAFNSLECGAIFYSLNFFIYQNIPTKNTRIIEMQGIECCEGSGDGDIFNHQWKCRESFGVEKLLSRFTK